jgi:hypothetical protein
MAYCKPIYTLFRNGALLVNGGTAEEVAASALADYEKFCPTTTPPPPALCNVEFLDIAFDGTNFNFTITLAPESNAPYLFFSSTTALAETNFTPTPDFPLTISFPDLFPDANLSQLTNIAILGSQIPDPQTDDDICDSDIIYFKLEESAYSESVNFALPTSLEGCEGALTYAILFSDATTSGITGTTLNVQNSSVSITLVAIYCDGLIHSVYTYAVTV